jgi:hypothetical protein
LKSEENKLSAEIQLIENKKIILKQRIKEAINAELLAVREVGSELEADVLFDCVIREDLGTPASVKEVWHFTKSKFSQQPKWFLDGIQQVDA